MARTPEEIKLLETIVQEVDEAREVYEVANQLVKFLPIRSFEDVIRAGGAMGRISFREQPFAIRPFERLIPTVLFPIEDIVSLVTVLNEVVRIAPKHIQYDQSKPEHAKRRLRRMGLQTLRTGRLGPTPGPEGFTGPNVSPTRRREV